MSPDDIKGFDDPLMSRVKRRETKSSRKKAERSEGRGFPWATVLAGIALAAALGALAYYLVHAQNRIEELNQNLVASQERLVEVTEKLGESQEQIQTLETGLQKSEALIGQQKQELGQTKNLVTTLKSSQADQEKELQTLAVKKADQEQVAKLEDKTSGIQQEVGAVNSRVDQANSNIGQLREATAKNSSEIEGNRAAIGEVKVTADGNTVTIDGVKRSLEREYYTFELEENGGIMKVFDVSLKLKDANFKDQKFTIEIIANGKTIKKKGQAINEPIYFYAGDNKRYELLVNRIDKKLIVGYVSVPKT